MANHLFDGLMANAQLDHVFARMPDGRSYTYQDVLDVSARVDHGRPAAVAENVRQVSDAGCVNRFHEHDYSLPMQN